MTEYKVSLEFVPGQVVFYADYDFANACPHCGHRNRRDFIKQGTVQHIEVDLHMDYATIRFVFISDDGEMGVIRAPGCVFATRQAARRALKKGEALS